MMPHLILVGYRACGKSTIGRLAAMRLGWPFKDSDAVLEERLGMGIGAFFAAHGEAEFRQREASLIAELLDRSTALVLATGGGAVITPATRDRLRQGSAQRGDVVAWLRADPVVVQERLRRHLGDRPSLTGASPVDEAPRIMATREPWYRDVATCEIDTAVDSPEKAADQLADVVRSAFKRG
jgi:shikimate kinase